jgi:hypothetical protein
MMSPSAFDDLAAELGWAIDKAKAAEKAKSPDAPALRDEADRLRTDLLKAAERTHYPMDEES